VARTPSLHATAIANGGYCALTAALLIAHRATVTGWGLAYFACEMGVILAIAGVEWGVATAPRRE
jgi:hypothetical protein